MNVDIYVDERLIAFPGIFCAHCGKTIKDASNANFIFRESRVVRSHTIKDGIHTVHKECDRPFVHSHPCGPDEKYSWIQLDAALYMLLRNCRYKPGEGKRLATTIFA
jgi:hypothetical protein